MAKDKFFRQLADTAAGEVVVLSVIWPFTPVDEGEFPDLADKSECRWSAVVFFLRQLF